MSDIENLAGDTRPIGVFDSGLGGLTVARAIATALPHESVYYFGDTKRCPYGTRTEDEVRSFALQAGRWLSKHDVKIMVIACNTATSVAAAELRATYQLPIIGMEPALKPAHELRRGGAILVLATPMTLRLEKFRLLMARYGEGAVPLPCPGLMELVEQEAFDQARQYLTELFAPYDLTRVDAVVLGCTHYVFLRPVLQEILPENVQVLDGNLGTARQLRRVLEERDLLSQIPQGCAEFLTSGDPEIILPQMNRLFALAKDLVMS